MLFPNDSGLRSESMKIVLGGLLGDGRQGTVPVGSGLVWVALLLAGCQGKAPAPAGPEPVRPAIIQTVGQADAGEKLRFPGRLRAAKRAELSFNVPGFVVEIAVTEGARVAAGQVVARLDDSVFRARVVAAQSEFERSRVDLERYQRLLDSEQAVARAEVDDRRARLEVARTNLAAAQQDLSDTVIRAPFAGVVTKRRLETFASVQAKQPIAELQNLGTLEVVIHVPQRMLRNEGARAQAVAFFDEREDHPVPVVVKSYASEADPVTQNYEVVLALQSRPEGITLLPGMSVTVLPTQGKAVAAEGALTVPLTAVTSDAARRTFVWVVSADGRVRQSPVVLGEVRGGQVKVASGLSAGERIVTAGVSSLREGMKVRPLDAR
jgi:RND family efflux transporter MFP subunit